jgi:hypothetical protein
LDRLLLTTLTSLLLLFGSRSLVLSVTSPAAAAAAAAAAAMRDLLLLLLVPAPELPTTAATTGGADWSLGIILNTFRAAKPLLRSYFAEDNTPAASAAAVLLRSVRLLLPLLLSRWLLLLATYALLCKAWLSASAAASFALSPVNASAVSISSIRPLKSSAAAPGASLSGCMLLFTV